MHYTDPHFSIPQQVAGLLSKGLDPGERPFIEEKLKSVPYCRLKQYWVPLLHSSNPNRFQPGVTFQKIWRRYTFDRQLRLLVMDAIERVEVAIRRLIIDELGLNHGATGYLNHSIFSPKWPAADHQKLVDSIRKDWSQNKDELVLDYKARYTLSPDPPLWFALEVTSFGTVVTLYRNMKWPEKRGIARALKVQEAEVFQSWLLTLNYIRNLCAHQGRLWNRQLNIAVKTPTKHHHPDWHSPSPPPNDRTYVVLLILRYLQGTIAAQSSWLHRLSHLLESYEEIPLTPMGFPTHWHECPIWSQPTPLWWRRP